MRGNAMIETAILAAFVYTPLFLVVIVFGEFGLAKTGAQVAGLHAAWRPETITSSDAEYAYIPPVIGAASTTFEFRDMGTKAAPEFTNLGPDAADTSRDVQAMLFAMAIGELHSKLVWEGGELVPKVTQSGDSVSRYLISPRWIDPDEGIREPGLIRFFEVLIPDQVAQGQELAITDPAAASQPTPFVLAITRLLNGPAHTPESWMLEPEVAIDFTYRTWLVRSLDRDILTGEGGKLEGVFYDAPAQGGAGAQGPAENRFDLSLRFSTEGETVGDEERTEDPVFGIAPGFIRNPGVNRVSDNVRHQLQGLSPALFTLATGQSLTGIGPGEGGETPRSFGVEHFGVPGDGPDQEEPGQEETP